MFSLRQAKTTCLLAQLAPLAVAAVGRNHMTPSLGVAGASGDVSFVSVIKPAPADEITAEIQSVVRHAAMIGVDVRNIVTDQVRTDDGVRIEVCFQVGDAA